MTAAAPPDVGADCQFESLGPSVGLLGLRSLAANEFACACWMEQWGFQHGMDPAPALHTTPGKVCVMLCTHRDRVRCPVLSG